MATEEAVLSPTFDDWFKTLSNIFQAAGDIDDVSDKFSQCPSDEEKFAFLWDMDIIHSSLNIPSDYEGKSSVKAKELRSKGNEAFQKNSYTMALEFYTQSVAFAPNRSVADGSSKSINPVELALAFANRSAALFHMKKYTSCLQDIKYAVHNEYPKDLAYKLLDRKAKCNFQLGNYDEAELFWQEAKSSLEKSNLSPHRKKTWEQNFDQDLSRCTKLSDTPVKLDNAPSSTQSIQCDASLPVVADKNDETFEALSSACEVCFSSEGGRYIVAARDIVPGEVLVVEKPYSSVMLPKATSKNCHHCYMIELSLLPCFYCHSVMFCSVSCRNEAWFAYHQAECPCLDIIKTSGIGKFGQLAVRTITMSTLQKMLQKRSSFRSATNKRDKRLLGCNEKGKYLSNSYETIYCLVTHGRERPVHNLFRRAALALYLIKCMQTSGYFTDNDGKPLDTKENMVFIGGMIMSLLQLLPCNAHEISELELIPNEVALSVPVEIGAGIYSTLSLFNHSCDPTVTRNFYGDTCVVRAIKCIMKGEEVSDNYGAVYPIYGKKERLEKLKPQYYFNCQCHACTADWPMYDGIPCTSPRFKCSNCSSPLVTPAGATASAVCTKCDFQNNVSSMITKLQSASADYGDNFRLLLSGDVTAALPGLLKHLEIMQKLLVLPWQEFSNCQEAVKQCFSVMSNCWIR